jgi:hypothetical protein
MGIHTTVEKISQDKGYDRTHERQLDKRERERERERRGIDTDFAHLDVL